MCPSSVSSPHTGLLVLAIVLGMQVQGEEHGAALYNEDQQEPDKEPRKGRKQGHFRHLQYYHGVPFSRVSSGAAGQPLPTTC